MHKVGTRIEHSQRGRNSVLIVDDLSKTYRSGGGQLAAVRNVSFRVDNGETVAIVGGLPEAFAG